MGIFSIFSRKGKPAAEKPQQPSKESIYYGDIAAWLDTELSREIRRLGGRASALCSDVVSKAGKLEEKIAKLGSSSFDPHDKTYAAVNMTKDAFVKKSMASLSSISRYDANDYGKLVAFRDSARSALDSARSTTPKQALLISNYFKEQGADIVKGVREAESALAQLSGFLEGDGMLLKKAAEAKEKAALLARVESECRTKQGELGKLSEMISSLEADVSRKTAELENFIHSSGWSSHLLSMEKLAGLERQMKGIEQEANNLLSVLRRPMKKLSHEKGTMALPENPFRGIIMAGGKIESITRNISEAAEAGEIDLKPSERERIIALEQSASEIGKLKDSYNDALLQYEKLKVGKESSIEKKKSSMESALSGMEEERQRLQREIDDLGNEIRRKHEERERQKEETRRAVQEASGKEVAVIMQKDSG